MIWSQASFPGLTNELPNIDPSMTRLAQYLMDGLNEAIAPLIPNVVAVRAIDCYNSLPTDLSRFPLLKVYRSQETYTHNLAKGKGIITYCLSFPDEQKIPGILRWVAININLLLRNYATTNCKPYLDINEEYSAEYRVMSLNSEPVYSLLQFTFNYEEPYASEC